MSQPVDCLAPCSVEAFLDRRIAPLNRTFVHMTAKEPQRRRSLSSPGFYKSNDKASVLKLELISQPPCCLFEDTDSEGAALDGVQLSAMPWPDTDEENCGGIYEEEVTRAQLPTILCPDTDDERDGACFEEEEANLAEPSFLWPDTDNEGSEFDGEEQSSKLPCVMKGMQVWSGQHPANLPAPQETANMQKSTNQSALQEATNRAKMACAQRRSLPTLLGSLTSSRATKLVTEPPLMEAQPAKSFGHQFTESPESLAHKLTKSPKTTLSIAELLDDTQSSPVKTLPLTPQNLSVTLPAAPPCPPSIAPQLQASQLGSFSFFAMKPESIECSQTLQNLPCPGDIQKALSDHFAVLLQDAARRRDTTVGHRVPLQQPPPPPPQHASTVGQPLFSVPPPPSHDASCPVGASTESTIPATFRGDVPMAQMTPTELSAVEAGSGVVGAIHDDEWVNDDDALQPQGVTTMMIRNIPPRIMQTTFMQELNKSGFRGLYDFCYLPTCFQKVESKGFAFVNFTSPAAAGKFVGTWHRTRRFGQHETALNISPATTQGLEANKKNWAGPRIQRIRNPNLRPWIIDQAQSDDIAPSSCDSNSTYQ